MPTPLSSKLLLLFPLIVLGQWLFAAEFNIEGKIEGINGGKVFLQEFHGAETQLIDSTFADDAGSFSFIFPSSKAPGQYRLIFSERRFIDLIFNKESIKFSTNLAHLIDDMRISASAENQLYYQYLKFRVKSQKRISELKKQLYAYDSAHVFFRELIKEYNSLIFQENEFTETLIHGNPGMFAVKLIRIDREPNPDPRWNSAKKNQWIFNNFPKHFSFNDTALLRTNAVSAKIIAYLSLALSLHNHPDSLNRVLKTASFRLLAATAESETMFRFMQQYLTNGFKKLGYSEIEETIAEIPYPCCPCIVDGDAAIFPKAQTEKMPAVISLRNSEGIRTKTSLRGMTTYMLFNAPGCKWGDLMAEHFEKRVNKFTPEESFKVIYKEGEKPTFHHSSGFVYFISDKNLDKMLKIVGLNQRPLLITIDEEGNVAKTITSWLELM
jgi:hypothetical protein